MTPRGLLSRMRVALLLGAFALSACGGSTPTAAPTIGPTDGPTAAVSQPPATPAITAAPATPAPVTPAPATEPPATTAPDVDPAADLEIGRPYEFEPLEESLAAVFVAALEHSLGSMADDIQIGPRTAVRNGEMAGFVIVMRFVGMPVTKALLEGAAVGAAGGADVEKRNIGGQPVRIISAQGQSVLLMLIDDDLVMVIGTTRNHGLGITTAIIEAN